MSKKFFSIITVVLNSKNNLNETINCLRQQSFKDFEYIVIDGGSTDGTLDIINNNLDIISFHKSEKDKGIYDAINKGLKFCNGKYIGILNAGDKYTLNGLEIINKYLVNNNFDFIFGSVMKKVLRYGYRKNRIFWNFDFYSSHSSGFFIKSESQNKLGNYNLKYKISSDYDLFYRMIVKNKMLGISTKKNELIGIWKTGESYSSKWKFIDHLQEEMLIRMDNNQNIIAVFFIYFIHYFKNIKKIENTNKIKFFFNKFKEILDRRQN